MKIVLLFVFLAAMISYIKDGEYAAALAIFFFLIVVIA